MAVEDQDTYRNFDKLTKECGLAGANLAVVTVSGMGASYLLKSWAEKNGVEYRASWPEKKTGTVVVDMPENSWDDWEKIYKEAPRDLKLIMVISARLMKEKGRAKDWVMSHIYKFFYLGARNKDDALAIIGEIKNDFNVKETESVIGLSGGIPKLIKWLTVNRRDQGGIEVVARPIVEETRLMAEEDLEKLGLIEKGRYLSPILEKLVKEMPDNLNIEVKFDLELVENGKPSGVKLTVDEKKIILEMMANEGMITREKIAEIKWGEGSYDKFSDQAINMAMRRLSRKFKVYEIETVPRVGYQIKQK